MAEVPKGLRMTAAESAYTWDAAVAFVATKGFTEHFRIGNAPTADYGTLHYFKRPGSDGLASDGYATVACIDSRWLVTIFEHALVPSLRIVGGTDYGD